jgi:hypothetical protein
VSTHTTVQFYRYWPNSLGKTAVRTLSCSPEISAINRPTTRGWNGSGHIYDEASERGRKMVKIDGPTPGIFLKITSHEDVGRK